MAKYDVAFAELQAKLAATLAVLENHPELHEELRESMGITEIPNPKGEAPGYDEARANALTAELRQFDAALGITVEPDVDDEDDE